MRFPVVALACWLVACVGPVGAQTAASPAPLTLAEAMRLAESAHPLVRSREAQLAAAEGARRDASSLLFNNPSLSAQRARRRTALPQDAANEWAVGFEQPIETGGQQSRRREAAAATLDALRSEIEAARRQARAEAALRFHAVLAAQRRVQLEQRSLTLFEGTAGAVGKRLAAGEDTRLDANVALIEAERARNALASAREQLLDARTDLGATLQLPPSALPDVAGDLAEPSANPSSYDVDRLVESARSQPDQRALDARVEAAKARVGLERAARSPDVTVGINVGREGASAARERVTALTLSMPLPLFRRNEAAIGQAMSEANVADIERAGGAREAESKVRRLWARLASQRERVQRLQSAVASASADNQRLALRSRAAGQIGLLDQLLVNRQSLDAERELNDALAEYHATRIELEHAAGWSQEGRTK